jgi:hypothetical protein
MRCGHEREHRQEGMGRRRNGKEVGNNERKEE